MAWFWNAMSAARKAELAALQTLREDVDRLQAMNAEALRSQAEWQTSAENAIRERETVRSEMSQTISSEREEYADKISGMNLKHEVLESDLKVERQKLTLLDEANLKMAEMLRVRDQTINDLQESKANEIRQRDTQIRQQDEKRIALEGELAKISARESARIEEMNQQLATLNEESSTRLNELAQQLTATSERAAARAAELEQQLIESETRSANRAEQRSALLRNLTEIHRLSEVSAKEEAASEALKILKPSWPEEGDRSASESA